MMVLLLKYGLNSSGGTFQFDVFEPFWGNESTCSEEIGNFKGGGCRGASTSAPRSSYEFLLE